MKIGDHYTTQMVGAKALGDKKKKEVKAGEGREPAVAVAVNISGKGHEIARARSLALAAPPVRQEMVDEVVGLLERGEYRITGEDVAPKMIAEHLALWNRGL